MQIVKWVAVSVCALLSATTGCAMDAGDMADEVAANEVVGDASQALSKPFKIKARRAEICLRASWSVTPINGNLVGQKCGTEADFYFTYDDQRRLVTNTGHCVGIDHDGPSGVLLIQDCSNDKDQKWTFRQQTERKIDAWSTKWIQFVENDNVGNFLRLPNQTPNTAATASGWSRSFWRDYDWAQDFAL